MCFPVWRELKLSLLLLRQVVLPFCLNVLSRLKGIETKTAECENQCDYGEKFKCAFPFEGNWNNPDPRGHQEPSRWFKCAFPFEGNWNGLLPLMDTVQTKVLFKCAFPFEGNWNFIAQGRHKPFCLFKCAFPFEGNWNFLEITPASALSPLSLNVLSRLKGIETFTSRVKAIASPLRFKCAFPFEGNWN